MKKEPFLDRIERRIERIPFSGCWIFTGYVNKKGYGIMSPDAGGGSTVAHRNMYAQVNKITISDLEKVLHRCDVPSCVNPDHLFLGTDLDNHLDSIAKGRKEDKLTPEIVAEIRMAFDTRTNQRWGAILFHKKYGISKHSLWRIVTRQSWCSR